MKVRWKNWILKISGLFVILLMVACESFLPAGYNQEQTGKCLKWDTYVMEKRERLPYPLQGEIIREELITYCARREQEDETALVIRGPSIYI